MKKLPVANHYFRFFARRYLRRTRGVVLLVVLLASVAGVTLWTKRASAFANNLGSWGTAGSGDGQFAGPLGVAIDLVGNVYVVDSGNNRIQKFNTSGTFVSKWGAAGSGNGQFNNPAGIAVDPAGNVYVADTFNNRIQQFTSAGVFVSKFGQSGTGEGQFQHPYAVAADRVGNLYVADSDNHRIEKFDTSGNFLLQWGGHGTGNGLFDNPRGVAVDVSGNVYVTDVGNNRVQKFGPNGNYLTQWGSAGTNPGQFGFVAGVVVDTMGYVYVTDASNNNVQKFTSNGAFASKLDGNPSSPLNTPFGCAVDTLGNLYVSNGNNKIVKLGNHGPEMYWTLTIDQQMGAGLSIAIDKAGDIYATDGGYQILKFHPDGTFVTTWGGNGNNDGQFAEPFGIAFDSIGNVYVTDVFRPQVQVFTPDGVYVRKFAIPGGSITRGIALDRFDNVYIADESANSVKKLTNSGSLIVEWGGGPVTLGVDGKFYTPSGVAIDYAGHVYVTDLGNNRVQVFDEDGNFLSKFGSKGTGNGQMYNARGLGVDLAGNIYLADTLNSRMEKFTPVGVFYETWGSLGGQPGQFHDPFGAAVDTLGNVFVMDTDSGRIQKFSQGAPVANAGPNQLFNCVKTPTQSVTLDASGTTDPTPNDTREYHWSEGTTYLGSGQTLTYSFPTGPEHIVTLVVTDGDNYSSTATMHLKVNAYDHATCNTAPVANDDTPAAIDEDNLGTTISVLANDTDYDNDSLTVTSFTAPAHGSAHIGGNGTILTYTPAADYFGSDSFTYSISDGHGGTAQATVNLTINPVNDPPSFTKGANQTVNEDSGAQTVVGWATNISKGPANESNQTVNFIVTNDLNALFSVQPAISADGTLTYTPAPDANGHTNVTVKIHDDGGGSDTSPAQIFSITVNAVNDPPSFVKGADQNINEDAGPQTVTGWATSISQGPNEFGQKPLTFNVTVTGTTGNLAFGAAPAIDGTTGTLTYAVNNGTNGTASVSVTLTDSGSNTPPNVNTSAAQSFQISVGAVNDPPVNTVPGPLQIPQDTLLTFSGSRTVSVSDLDAAEAPSDGVITVSLTATNGTLKLSGTAGLSFSVGDGVDDAAMTFAGTIPAINAALNGMTFAPSQGFNGAAGVEILTSDQGKTGSGGVQTDDDTISITVDPLAAIYLNEVAFNPDATGQNEYLEFRGAPNFVIPAGTYFVVVDGTSGQLGNVKTLINLSGLSFGSNGFLVLLQNGNSYVTAAGANVIGSTGTDPADAGFGGLPGNIYQGAGGAKSIEDDSATFLVIQTGVTPSLGDSIDTNNDGIADGPVYSGWSVRDSVGHVDGDSGDHGYGSINYSVSGSSASSGVVVPINFIPSYIGRRGDTTAAAAVDWLAGSSLSGAAPNFALNTSPNSVEPSSYAGKPLNHIGASNFGNAAPVNSIPAAQTVSEDTDLVFTGSTQISIADADAGNSDVQVTLTAVNGSMSMSGTANLVFSIGSGTGDQQMRFTGKIADINSNLNNLTFTPSLNFASPPNASLTIETNDLGNTGVDGAKSTTDTIQISVNAINDPPSFTKGPDKTVNEDAGPQTFAGWATNISAGPNEMGQVLTFNVMVTSTTGNLAFTNAPAIDAATGNLTFTTSPDTNGTATVSVTLSDDGSNVPPNSNTSAPQTFQITVIPVNDPPSFTKGANQTVNEDSGAQTVIGWATNISKGPADESSQTVDFIVTNDNKALFSAQPAVTADGTLTYTPAPDANGSANVTVKIHDDGGGSDTSAPQSFTITVNAVNDPPSFVKGADQNINEDAGPQTVTGWATNISQGPNESGQTPLTFNVTVTGTTGDLVFSVAPAIDATTGTLTYAVNNGTNGTASVSVTLSDSGSNVPPNSNISAPQTFQINVGAINDPPVNTVPGPLQIPQDTVLTFTGNRTVSVADPDAADSPSDGVITVSLTATNGTLKLSATAGLSFSAGDGVDDAAMTFDGSIPAINAALNGMTFAPAHGFNGAAGVEIFTSDQGKTGSGGVKTDDDAISITVDPLVSIYLNEIAFDPDSSGQNEYLEFRGAPNSVIPAGTYFVIVDGTSGHLGEVNTLINLSGLSFGSNGFLVLLQNGNSYVTTAGATVITSTGSNPADAGFGGLPGNIYQANGAATSIKNDSATFMVIQTGLTPALADDIDTNNDGLADGWVYSGWSVRDSVGHVDGNQGDHGYGLINYSTAGSGSSAGMAVPINFVSSYLGRRGDTASATAADWVASSAPSGAAPNFTLNASAVEPSSYIGKPLNHIGAGNFADSAPVNSVPGVQSVNEDTALVFTGPTQISVGDSDAGNNDVQVTLTSVNGSISLSTTANLTFSIGGGAGDQQMRFTGKIADINSSLNNLTFTPSANFSSPPNASVTIETNDLGNTGSDGAKSTTDTIQITVNAVNDPPSFVKGADQIVNEDAGPQTVTGWASHISAGPNETGQALAFNCIVTGTTGNLAFTNSPAIDATTGNLNFTTAPDSNGTATVSVTLSDDGSNVPPSSNTSAAQTFQITVNPVNDAPSFQLAGDPPAISKNAGPQSVDNFAADFKPGPATATDESTQTLIGYSLTQTGATGNLSFSNAPAIDRSGKLTYTPAANTNGTATYSVVATDSGAGTAPNINKSAPSSFTITVRTGGALQFSNPSYSVSENSGPAVVTITRTGGNSGIATVRIASSDGTATAGPDYTALSQTVTFNDGETSKNVSLSIIDDLLNESDETVNLTLSDVSGSGELGSPATAVLTIMDDDPVGGYVRFSAPDFHVNENDGVATITVERVGSLGQAVTVDYATGDNSAPAALLPCAPTPGNTLANSRCDYNTATGTLSWAAGDSATRTFTIPINQDSYVEGPESVSLTLSNPTGSAELMSPSTATLTIADDVGRTTNPLDDSEGFVRQHYHDFLNREADPAGLQFWKKDIDHCNDPAQRPTAQTLQQCIELARINTSAAFFLSIEFQTTGGTAYLTNKVAFGGPPTFLPLQTDAQMLGRGYVVGQPGADAILEANKVAYFNAFLARREVVNTYAGLSDQIFVDTLIRNTGVTFAQTERDALLNGLLNHAETRATVLRKIVEKPEFRQAEFNSMFVLMEYFGYLRRDADMPGFTFWLTKLNSFNGDYLQAEMVKAFLSSSEYRQRFGN